MQGDPAAVAQGYISDEGSEAEEQLDLDRILEEEDGGEENGLLLSGQVMPSATNKCDDQVTHDITHDGHTYDHDHGPAAGSQDGSQQGLVAQNVSGSTASTSIQGRRARSAQRANSIQSASASRFRTSRPSTGLQQRDHQQGCGSYSPAHDTAPANGYHAGTEYDAYSQDGFEEYDGASETSRSLMSSMRPSRCGRDSHTVRFANTGPHSLGGTHSQVSDATHTDDDDHYSQDGFEVYDNSTYQHWQQQEYSDVHGFNAEQATAYGTQNDQVNGSGDVGDQAGRVGRPGRGGILRFASAGRAHNGASSSAAVQQGQHNRPATAPAAGRTATGATYTLPPLDARSTKHPGSNPDAQQQEQPQDQVLPSLPPAGPEAHQQNAHQSPAARPSSAARHPSAAAPASGVKKRRGSSPGQSKHPPLQSLSSQAQTAAALMDALMAQGAQQAVRSRSLIRVQVRVTGVFRVPALGPSSRVSPFLQSHVLACEREL
jgi:hypothetical protein